jgi:hypothetical protein
VLEIVEGKYPNPFEENSCIQDDGDGSWFIEGLKNIVGM